MRYYSIIVNYDLILIYRRNFKASIVLVTIAQFKFLEADVGLFVSSIYHL